MLLNVLRYHYVKGDYGTSSFIGIVVFYIVLLILGRKGTGNFFIIQVLRNLLVALQGFPVKSFIKKEPKPKLKVCSHIFF